MPFRPPQYLSKTDFMRWRLCPSYAWIAKHSKQDVPPEPDQEMLERRFRQGDAIEAIARQRFGHGVEVRAFGAGGADFTKQLIAEGKSVIFQATALSEEGYMARADVLELTADGYALWEVKSSMRVKDEHLLDVTFQKLAFERAGVPIVSVGVIHLNRYYRKEGEFDPSAMFIAERIDEKVAELMPGLEKEAAAAFNYLSSPLRPTTCTCNTRPRWEHCPTFPLFHPDVPEYSIFRLSKLGTKVLKDLGGKRQYAISDLPSDVKLSDKAANQVLMEKTKKPNIDVAAIKRSFSQLRYPLWFLDYETTTSGIPLFEGTRPYQNMPFQYSLHVMREPGGDVEHLDFLATHRTGVPVEELCAALQEHLGPEGSVLVWNKRFEMGCNDQMAEMAPQYKEFLQGVNDRVYDLMEVFWDQRYLHPGFKGSASIKAVLPVLVPELTYDDLAVQKGDRASALWEDSLDADYDPIRREQLYEDLRKYCALDTLAMVRVYQHLVGIVGEPEPSTAQADS